MNDYQKHRFSRRMVESLFNTVSGKRIAIYGFAFKKDTNDTRESAAIYVCKDLLSEQARLTIYDPKVTPEQIYADLELNTEEEKAQIEIHNDPYAAAENAHALAIITEWDEFKTLDYKRIYEKMLKPAFIFDGRNILDIQALKEIGYETACIGKS